MNSDEYQCVVCRGVFKKGWSDDEALAELDELWAVPPAACALVCEDCFKGADIA